VIGNLQKKIALRKSIESEGTAPAPAKESLTATIRERQATMPKSLGPEGEVSRIVSMPVVRKMEREEVEAFSRARVLRHAFEAGFRLNPDQAEALKAYEDYGGVLAPIGVGRGKTLASLMIADAAYRRGINKIVLHLPPTIVSQLVGNDIRWARNRVPISFPIHVLHGMPEGNSFEESIASTVEHEVIHWSQRALPVIMSKAGIFGLPSTESGLTPSSYDGRAEYLSSAIEFFPWLNNEIREARSAYGRLDKWQVKIFIASSTFFVSLKQKRPDLWKKAVREFYREMVG